MSTSSAPDTRLASEVNGIAGLWVSLSIADDDYWVYINRDPVARTYGTQWIGWAAVALLLSVIGAILITRLINRPLAQLSRASAELGSGRNPAPLPETGPIEIRTVNESFNRMVTDLGKLEADRALLLAGISHDLRTPLSRLRLELEMAPLPEGSRAAMVGDIEQMDAIVRQFLDYARKAPQAPASRSRSQRGRGGGGAACAHRRRTRLVSAICISAPNVRIRGFATEIDRALDNLLTNAVRYGRDSETGQLHVTVSLTANADHATRGGHRSRLGRLCRRRSIDCCGRSNAAKPRARAVPAPVLGCRLSTASPACTPAIAAPAAEQSARIARRDDASPR